MLSITYLNNIGIYNSFLYSFGCLDGRFFILSGYGVTCSRIGRDISSSIDFDCLGLSFDGRFLSQV
jgi:hypothetical protein